MFEVQGLGLAAAGRWGLAKLPCSEHAVTVMSPQLKTKNQVTLKPIAHNSYR